MCVSVNKWISQRESWGFIMYNNHKFLTRECFIWFGFKLFIYITRISKEIIYAEVHIGEHVSIQYVCCNCSIQIDGKMFEVNVFPMDIKGFNIFLGMD